MDNIFWNRLERHSCNDIARFDFSSSGVDSFPI